MAALVYEVVNVEVLLEVMVLVGEVVVVDCRWWYWGDGGIVVVVGGGSRGWLFIVVVVVDRVQFVEVMLLWLMNKVNSNRKNSSKC